MAVRHIESDFPDFPEKLVSEYQRTSSQTVFTAIYEYTSIKLQSSVTRAALRYRRLDELELKALADDALVDAVQRFQPEHEVPFMAWLHYVVSRRISEHVRSTYYTGKRRDTERPQNASIDAADYIAVPEPETSIDPELAYLKVENPVLYDVTIMLMNDYPAETIGRVIGKKTSYETARSWTRRQKSLIAVLLTKFRLQSQL